MNRVFVRQRTRLAVALLAVFLIFIYTVVPSALRDGVEHSLYDALVSAAPPVAHEARVVIVDIDERSLARYGAWPWPRSTMAQLVNELIDRHQVGLLGVDIVFPQRRGGDAVLQAAFAEPRVVLSQTLDFAAASTNRVGELADCFTVAAGESPQASGYVANDRVVLPPNAAVGHITPVIDSDGHIRRVYPVACIGSACTMTLALRMYTRLTARGRGAPSLVLAPNARLWRVDLTNDEPLDLPLDEQRALLVPYRVAPGGFQVLSVADVMDHARNLPELDNAIVLLGSSAMGIGDRVATPLARLAAGVEVHAQLLTALLDRSFIRPLSAEAPGFLAMGALIVLSYLYWPRNGRALLLAWPLLALASVSAVLSWLMLSRGLLLPLTPLPLLVLAMALLTGLQQNFALAARVRLLGSQFSQFLPAILVDRLLRGTRIGPETERHMMTVLIVDVRGFTAESEDKTPEQIAKLAQKCFEVLSAEVALYQGTIEKYSGDGLMALWGMSAGDGVAVPPLRVRPAHRELRAGVNLDHATYAAQAVSAAVAMQGAVDGLAYWFAEHGYAKPMLSIGLNTGQMSVGVFGGRTHLAWSAQGQAFNLASRIERLTRDVGENLLMGEQTALLLAPDAVRKIGDFALKGVSAPVAVYALQDY